MKRTLLFLSLTIVCVSLQAQLKTPQASPFSKVEQKVGLTDVTFEYSRPSMKNRTIFGGLVPHNELWRTGANKNTTITVSDDVKIGGKELKKGSYAIFTKPTAKQWEIIFYADTNNWGTPGEWDNDKVAASVTANVEELPFDIETFTIELNNLNNNGADLMFFWEKTFVRVPLEVPTREKAFASIEKLMKGPDANQYYAAASYYLAEGKDLQVAKEWIDAAVELRGDEGFWILRKKALIHAKLGDKKGAIEAAKRSLTSAKKAGNDDYIKMNEASLAEWQSR